MLCAEIVSAIRKSGLASEPGWSAFVAAAFGKKTQSQQHHASSSTSPSDGKHKEVDKDNKNNGRLAHVHELLTYRHVDARGYERKCLEAVANRVRSD